MKLEISEQTVNKFLAYLQNQPYIHVAGIINELRQLKPVEKPVDNPAGKEE